MFLMSCRSRPGLGGHEAGVAVSGAIARPAAMLDVRLGTLLARLAGRVVRSIPESVLAEMLHHINGRAVEGDYHMTIGGLFQNETAPLCRRPRPILGRRAGLIQVSTMPFVALINGSHGRRKRKGQTHVVESAISVVISCLASKGETCAWR